MIIKQIIFILTLGLLAFCSEPLLSYPDHCITYKAMLQGHICASKQKIEQQYQRCLMEDAHFARYYRCRYSNKF